MPGTIRKMRSMWLEKIDRQLCCGWDKPPKYVEFLGKLVSSSLVCKFAWADIKYSFLFGDKSDVRCVNCDVLIVGSNPILNAAYATELACMGKSVIVSMPEGTDTWNYQLLVSGAYRAIIESALGIDAGAYRDTNEWIDGVFRALGSKVRSSLDIDIGWISAPHITTLRRYDMGSEKVVLIHEGGRRTNIGIRGQAVACFEKFMHSVAGEVSLNFTKRNVVFCKSIVLTSESTGLVQGKKNIRADGAVEIESHDDRVVLVSTASKKACTREGSAMESARDILNIKTVARELGGASSKQVTKDQIYKAILFGVKSFDED